MGGGGVGYLTIRKDKRSGEGFFLMQVVIILPWMQYSLLLPLIMLGDVLGEPVKEGYYAHKTIDSYRKSLISYIMHKQYLLR